MAETDRQKFKRLAEKRVSNMLKTIRLVGNLSNKSNYDYTSNDVEKIFSVIQRELKTCRAKFANGTDESANNFRLD